MPKTKEQKRIILEGLNERVKKQTVMIIVDFTGLKVIDAFNLRKQLKEVNAELKVAKKTLIQIALKNGNLYKNIREMNGEIALVFGYQDEILPAKVVYDFSRKNENLKILGGFFENEFQGTEKYIELAKLPSKEELLGRLVGSISSPLTGFVRSLQYNIKGLVFALNAIKENK